MSKVKKGIIMVYTGNGKGKTTAAIGLAVRAVGHGFNVLMIQFMKGRKQNYGEYMVANNLPGFKIIRTGRDKFVDLSNPDPEDVKLAKKGLELAEEAVKEKKYDMIILDEINVAIEYNLVNIKDVLNLLENKPKEMVLVLTGRNAAPSILEKADTVSEVKEIKHHYTKGIVAQEGIEF